MKKIRVCFFQNAFPVCATSRRVTDKVAKRGPREHAVNLFYLVIIVVLREHVSYIPPGFIRYCFMLLTSRPFTKLMLYDNTHLLFDVFVTQLVKKGIRSGIK
jgi:hypothetical protein